MTVPGPRLTFGGDYNPEQWPREVLEEDIALMREAGVDLVTVGVFAWAHLQPAPGEFRFDWLDEVMDRLGSAGISVDLATATASPPPWLAARHPEILPVTADGRTLWPGGRQAYCPSSPVFAEHALALCEAMGSRYAGHDALVMWHVSNELGCHNALCYCEVSAAAFRAWLGDRYGDIDRLNDAWGTAFWSQRYAGFDEILPPRSAPTFPNPTQQLDFRRFSSDQLLGHFIAERDILHRVSPGVPVTTNFMVMQHVRDMDYASWAPELDVVSNDHYLTAADPEAYRELAFSSDWVRGIAGNQPWIQMEHSTSAVNWQPRNIAKRPGELKRTSLQHVARGADGILFFQWRASRAGAEKFHSALLPHAGTDTRLWREVCDLGRSLDRIEEVAGSRAANRTAIIADWQAWWGCELDSHPSVDVHYLDQAHAWHAALTDQGLGIDVIPPSADLSSYQLIIVPTLYLVTDQDAEAIGAAAARGATVVVTYFSGIVDECDHIRLGGYPGAFRDLLGVSCEEFTPLREGEQVRLSTGYTATVWAEDLRATGADVVATFADGPVPDGPAITRRVHGSGSTWYVATRLDQAGLGDLAGAVVRDAGVAPIASVQAGKPELTRRVAEDGRSWVFVINHADEPAVVSLRGTELLTDSRVDGRCRVPGGGVAVVREE